MDDVVETFLAPEEDAEAIDRDDDIGRLFALAFALDVPSFPFQKDDRQGDEP